MSRVNLNLAQRFVSYQGASTSQVNLAVNPYGRKDGDTMNTPRGRFRWNEAKKKWEPVGGTSSTPPNAASYPTASASTTSGISGQYDNIPITYPTSGSANIPSFTVSAPPQPEKPKMLRQQRRSPVDPSGTEMEGASVTRVRDDLWKQQRLLEEILDGYDGDPSLVDDALYFVREALDSLNKAIGE
jgi:hypothetical protein